MNFDINLIIVPVTLVFLLIWLVDKFFLKKYRATKQYSQALKDAQQQVKSSSSHLNSVCQTHQLQADALVIKEDTPEAVRVAHQQHQVAQTQLLQLQGNPPADNVLIRWAYEFLPVLLVIVLVRSFVVEPFNIPSSSMVPTLYTGDFILVDKTSYGLRLPLLHTKIVETGSPQRGDVAVFRYPNNENIYYVKRIIGLPGDEIGFNNGVLSVNGKPVPTTATQYQMSQSHIDYLAPQIINDQKITDEQRMELGRSEEPHALYFQETLDNHQYKVRYLAGANMAAYAEFLQHNSPELSASAGKQWKITVPQGQYFAMGDNRDRSQDGRVWGFVADKHLSGKASYIWMSKEPGLKLPSFERVGAID